jgi:hypothetical protein
VFDHFIFFFRFILFKRFFYINTKYEILEFALFHAFQTSTTLNLPFRSRAGVVGINLTQSSVESSGYWACLSPRPEAQDQIFFFVMKDLGELRILEIVEKEYGDSATSNAKDGNKKSRVATLIGSFRAQSEVEMEADAVPSSSINVRAAVLLRFSRLE